MVCNRRSRRACKTNARSFESLYNEANDLTSFLFSEEDDSGSSSDSEDELLCDVLREDYDPADVKDPFDKYQGSDDWIGRRVCKTFGELGTFTGVIYKGRRDPKTPRYRLFSIFYFDDRTFEEMWPQQIVKHLIPEDKDGLDKDAREKHDNLKGLAKSQ